MLQRSYERNQDIKSFRAHIDLQITAPGEQVETTVDIETGRDGRVRTSFDIDTFGDKQSFEMIIAEPYVYVEVPGVGWTQVSAEAIFDSTGQSLGAVSDPTAFYSSLFPAEEVPWELYVVESLGRDEVDGVQTEHLSIQFDFQEVWQYLSEEQKQQFLQSSPDPEVAKEELIEAMEVSGVEVWIDDQGYSRRIAMEITFSGEGLKSLDGPSSIKLNMHMFDINEEITINLPEGYEDFEIETGPLATPAPNSVYDELLALIPDTPDTRSLVFLNDYVQLGEALNVDLPGPDANQAALENYFESLVSMLNQRGIPLWGETPFISGYSQYSFITLEMGNHLAFDLRNVRQSAVAGVPSGKLGVMLGDFDPAATESALENCAASVPDCEPSPFARAMRGLLSTLGEQI